jgi:hypothetical protein
MTNVSTALKGDVGREPESSNENLAAPAVVLGFDHPALGASNEAICLDSCEQSEKIVVNTRMSVYELIVLQGDVGDVLVRGGRRFPEFRRVQFVGSTAGGSALKVNTIDVGLRMEFHLGRRIVVTSEVQGLSRHALPADPKEGAVVQ